MSTTALRAIHRDPSTVFIRRRGPLVVCTIMGVGKPEAATRTPFWEYSPSNKTTVSALKLTIVAIPGDVAADASGFARVAAAVEEAAVWATVAAPLVAPVAIGFGTDSADGSTSPDAATPLGALEGASIAGNSSALGLPAQATNWMLQPKTTAHRIAPRALVSVKVQPVDLIANPNSKTAFRDTTRNVNRHSGLSVSLTRQGRT